MRFYKIYILYERIHTEHGIWNFDPLFVFGGGLQKSIDPVDFGLVHSPVLEFRTDIFTLVRWSGNLDQLNLVRSVDPDFGTDFVWLYFTEMRTCCMIEYLPLVYSPAVKFQLHHYCRRLVKMPTARGSSSTSVSILQNSIGRADNTQNILAFNLNLKQTWHDRTHLSCC